MSKWGELANWLYGDLRRDSGFWYSHTLWEIDGLTEEQLYWVPDPNSLCILWHVGHIAHRERTHIGRFLQGLKGELIPHRYEVFGPRWVSPGEIRESIDSVEDVLEWVAGVRDESRKFIASLSEEDFRKVPPTSEFEMSAAHWVFITVAHTALHIGKIQSLRAMVEGKKERPC